MVYGDTPQPVFRQSETSMTSDLWLVYLLECADGTLYCGITCHMERRLAQHNGVICGGARYTRGRRPVRLLASRPCACMGDALRLERAVKARPRHKKKSYLLNGDAEQC